ncbi:ABC transporter substrate-binding protein [Halovivax cerinus]|uniref:ABC transporter substrate-binding protein n=1 Tax=Halovivax cerinus TaxID=1487865 RepID=A0ABD5NRF5_9EURY|nr:ABC transporter substrate-binding protein [Halovivax cerinus]
MVRPTTVSRRRLLATGAAVSGAAVAGCIGGDGNGSGPGDGDGLVDPEDFQYDREEPDDEEAVRDSEIHYTQEQARAEDFDPIVSNDAYSFQVFTQVFDGLYEYDDGLGLTPKLATGEPAVENDGTRFVYEIVDGAEFSNGNPVTAADVEHSFIAPVLEQTENAPTYSVIESTEVVDDRTLQVDLAEPFGPWQIMTQAVTVVSKEDRLTDVEAYDEATPDTIEAAPDAVTEYVDTAYNDDPVENTIGSGPFEFESFELNGPATLVRRDDYWGDPTPYLQRVTFEAAADPSSRVSQIQADDTDVISGIPDNTWPELDQDGIRRHMSESPSYMYLAFNCTDEADTSSPEVRRAVCQSFSMQDFVETNASNTAQPITTPVPPITNEQWGFPMDEWNDEYYPEYDPDNAESLLNEHAPDDFNPTIICPEGIRADLAERIATRLDELGYGAQVQVLDFGTLVDTYVTGNPDDYEMYLLGWTGGPDPDTYLYNLFHEDSAGLNQGHFYEGSDTFHENILAARQTADQEERYDLYEPVLIEILEELPALPAFTQHNTMAAGTHVKDLHAHPDVSTNPQLAREYGNVWVDDS